MEIKKLHKTVQHDDLCLVYSGIFSDTMTDKIIDLSSVYLENNSELSKIRKRTSFLVAESFQNVVRHGPSSPSSKSDILSSGSFLIRFRDNMCFIASRNAVPLSRVDGIQRNIQDINRHNKDELKEKYKNILTDGSLSDKGGAGLGLIEMARKTENKLHYCFDKINDEFSEFYLMLVLDKREEDAAERVYLSELNTIIDIFKKNEVLNLFMLYQGDYGNTVINPVIKIISNTIDSISMRRAIRMKLYHAAVEMMHTINFYSTDSKGKKTGMFTIGKMNDSPVITAHYNIRLASMPKLEKVLEIFKNATPEELDMRYSKKLQIAKKTKAHDSWIGLIELARISHNWDYQMEVIDDNFCNLCFRVTI